MEGSCWFPHEIKNFVLYLGECGIDPERVTVITQNYNYAYEEFPFRLVHWNLMESFARVKAKEWIDYNTRLYEIFHVVFFLFQNHHKK